jgi:outer membrane receptor for ferrienterochelin and colicin
MTIADNDFFLGSRWTSNNMNDASILAGVILDKKTSETFYSVEAKTRLKENFLLSFELKMTTNSEFGEPSFPQSRDDYLELQINHFF